MRRAALLALGILVAALPATGAAGQDAPVSKELGVSGQTPQVCSIGNGRFKVSELHNFIDTSGDTLQVVQLLDPRDLSTREARATVSFAAVCNFPHRVRLESQDNGLWPLGGPMSPNAGGFASALPYSVALTWADKTSAVQMDAQIRRARLMQSDVDRAAAGELVLHLEIDTGASNTYYGSPVLAGAYADTLRVFLEPR